MLDGLKRCHASDQSFWISSFEKASLSPVGHGTRSFAVLMLASDRDMPWCKKFVNEKTVQSICAKISDIGTSRKSAASMSRKMGNLLAFCGSFLNNIVTEDKTPLPSTYKTANVILQSGNYRVKSQI